MKSLNQIRLGWFNQAEPSATILNEPAIVSEENKTVDEALNLERDPADKWVADYVRSTDDRFKGKSKSERIKMALSDYYAASKGTGKRPVRECSCDSSCQCGCQPTHESDEVSMTRAELDELADMADDLFNELPNHDECPAWVQHKVAGIHAGLRSVYDYYRQKNLERNVAAVQVMTTTPENPVPMLPPVAPAPNC